MRFVDFVEDYGVEIAIAVGAIILVGLRSADNGETVLHIKLDDPEESIRHCHVRIIEGEPA